MKDSVIDKKFNDSGYEDLKECVGCDTKENLIKCDGTMCQKCWEAENEEMPDLADIHNDNYYER